MPILANAATSIECGMGIYDYEFTDTSRCRTYELNCYQSGSTKIKMINCTSCVSGAELKQNQWYEGNSKFLYYNTCVCSNCSTSAWQSGNTGYEKRTACDFDTCEVKPEYRCAKNWYGSSTNGISGCNRCPLFSGGVYGETASAGTSSVSQCYVPANKTYTDSTGTFEFTRNCFYN